MKLLIYLYFIHKRYDKTIRKLLEQNYTIVSYVGSYLTDKGISKTYIYGLGGYKR